MITADTIYMKWDSGEYEDHEYAYSKFMIDCWLLNNLDDAIPTKDFKELPKRLRNKSSVRRAFAAAIYLEQFKEGSEVPVNLYAAEEWCLSKDEIEQLLLTEFWEA